MTKGRYDESGVCDENLDISYSDKTRHGLESMSRCFVAIGTDYGDIFSLNILY